MLFRRKVIVRLMEEANEEAEHKGWCDTELSTNEQTRNEKTEAVDLLNSEIAKQQAAQDVIVRNFRGHNEALEGFAPRPSASQGSGGFLY